MPQPLKEPATLHYEPKTIHLKRPKLAAAIGLVVSEWSELERHLLEMFGFSLFTFSEKENAATNVAKSALDALESLAARLAVIDALLKPRISADLYKTFAEKLAPEIRKRAGERNLVAHGHWNISNDHPDHLVLICEPPHMKYTVKDFEDIADRIIAASNSIGTFLHQVRESTKAPFFKKATELPS